MNPLDLQLLPRLAWSTPRVVAERKLVLADRSIGQYSFHISFHILRPSQRTSVLVQKDGVGDAMSVLGVTAIILKNTFYGNLPASPKKLGFKDFRLPSSPFVL